MTVIDCTPLQGQDEGQREGQAVQAPSAPSGTSNTRIAKAAAWTTGAVVAIRGFYLCSSFITARLLTPMDFGIIGIAGTIYMLIETSSITGVPSYIMYKQNMTRAESDTAFTVNAIAAVFFCLVILVAGAIVAVCRHQPQVFQVLFFAGLAFFVGTMACTPRAFLAKEMRQHVTAKIDMAVNALNLVLIVTFACLGFHYLSYIIPLLLSQILCCILVYKLGGHRFSLGIQKDVVRKIFNYSKSFAPQALLMDFLYQADYVVASLGFLTATMMGYYYFGFEKAFLATIFTRSVSEQVFFPAFSRAQNDHAALKEKYFKLTACFMFMLFPIFFIVILLAPAIMKVAYGGQWDNAVFTFQCIMAYCGMKICYDISLTLFNAIGRSDQNLRHFLFVTPHTILFFLMGAKLGGIAGLSIAALCAHTLSSFIMMARVKKFFGWPLKEQLLQMGRSMAPLAPILPVMLFLKSYLLGMHLNPILYIVNMGVVFTVLYLALAKCFNAEMLDECLGFIQRKLLSKFVRTPTPEPMPLLEETPLA